MKREFLKELGLTDKQIDKIMAENGEDIEKAKGDLESKESDLEAKKTEIEILQGQLKEANTQMEKFKEMDIDSIKAAADEYKEKYESAKADAEKELENLKFNHAIDKALTGAKARNTKAVKALLDMEGLKLTDDKILGLDEQLEEIKKENEFLFEVGKKDKPPKIILPGGDNNPKGITVEAFKDMGYLERIKLKQKDEGLYKQLNEEIRK